MNKTPWWEKIRYRVLVFGLLMSIFPLVALGVANINSTWKDIERTIHRHSMISARWIAKDINQLISNSIAKIELTTAAYTDLTKETALRQEIVLYSLMKEVAEIEEITLLDAQQTTIARVAKREVVTLGQEEMPKINFLSRQVDFGPVYYANDGRPLMNVHIPLWHKGENKRTGTMIVQLSLRGVMQKALRRDESGYFFVIDEQGRLIGHEDFSQVLKNTNVLGSQAVQQLLNGVNPLEITDPFKYSSYNNIKVLGAFTPVHMLNWGVVIEQPVKEALQPVYQLTYKFLAAMGGVMLVVSMLSIYFGLRFTEPIERLEAGAQVVAAGDLDHIIELKGEGEVAKLVAAFNNMTRELKVKSLNLVKEKELLDNVVDGVGVGLALINKDCTIIWANSRLKSWFNGEEILGQKCSGFFVDCSGYCANGLTGDNLPNELTTSKIVNGEKKYFRRQVFELKQNSPEDPKYLELIEDITARREMEAMIIQSEKLAAVGLLASGVAHEINNPLATINAYAQDVIDRLEEAGQALVENKANTGELEEMVADLKVISQQVQRCGQITGSLLNFARQSDWEFTLVDVNQLVLETVELLNYRLKKYNVKLTTTLAAHLPFVKASPLHLQQVLFNLLLNSLDALGNGGELEVSTKLMKDWLEVEIKDNGIGIKQQDLAKIFDPFFTTKPVGKGTGLGLSICYGIITKLKGEIKVESEEGVGTKVALLLPVIGE